MSRPPSITRVCPVQNLASSLAKKTAAPARSSGSSVDFIAVIEVIPEMYMSGTTCLVASVMVTPGAMQLTRSGYPGSGEDFFVALLLLVVVLPHS